jgi:hypothetical protein
VNQFAQLRKLDSKTRGAEGLSTANHLVIKKMNSATLASSLLVPQRSYFTRLRPVI